LLGGPLESLYLCLALYTLELGGFGIDWRSYGGDAKAVYHVQL
jgi:hypothetical protein